jgi:hypothetical protein
MSMKLIKTQLYLKTVKVKLKCCAMAYRHDTVHHKIHKFQINEVALWVSSEVQFITKNHKFWMVKPWVYVVHASIFQVAKMWRILGNIMNSDEAMVAL